MKIISILLISLLFLPTMVRAQKNEIVAYFPEWCSKGEHPYYVKDIEKRNSADKITVLNYAFLVPEPDSAGNIIPVLSDPETAYQQVYSSEMSVDGIADDSTQMLRGHFNQLKKLKQKHPDLKILLSIGGWSGSVYFSDAVRTRKSREYFINNCIERFISGNLPLLNGAGGEGAAAGIFDGFDIDWEYPVNGGIDSLHHHPDDNNNLSAFLALFRAKLDSIGPGYILTAAVPATEKYSRYYNIYNDQQYLDWYNLMTYDYHGEWNKSTGHFSNLLSSEADTTFDRERYSFDKTVHLYNCIYGVSRSKLVPGISFYGKMWKNVDSLNYGLGIPGSSDQEDSSISYNNFSDLKKMLNNGFKMHWDNQSMAPYLYNAEDRIFITFDNVKSVALKSHYVEAYNLRGLMFWDITGDDSFGALVNTIYTGDMPDITVQPGNDIASTPDIRIIKPLSTDWINEGTNVILQTEISENREKIVKVKFFGDGKSLGYCTEPPFNWIWFNISEGKHKVEAIGYDNDGSRGESIPVEITVREK